MPSPPQDQEQDCEHDQQEQERVHREAEHDGDDGDDKGKEEIANHAVRDSLTQARLTDALVCGTERWTDGPNG